MADLKPHAARNRFDRWWVKGLMLILILLIFAEVALRVQQSFGPLYDLEMTAMQASLVNLSDELNHLAPVSSSDGGYDANGIRRYAAAPDYRLPTTQVKWLFFGDSFTEGVGPADTIPQRFQGAAAAADRQLVAYNAGQTTYSPTIYIPQARKLMPLVKPDVAVVIIDQTDLEDDAFRYRKLAVLDGQGRVQAVKRSPIASELYEGQRAAVTAGPVYLWRALRKLYFTRVVWPPRYSAYRAECPTNFPLHIVAMADAQAARQEYADALQHFEHTIGQLADCLAETLGSADRVVFVCHPYRQHFVGDDRDGHPWNRLLFESVQRVAATKGVVYVDMTDSLTKRFGGKPRDFYDPVPGFHFNAAGLAAYGEALFEELRNRPRLFEKRSGAAETTP